MPQGVVAYLLQVGGGGIFKDHLEWLNLTGVLHHMIIALRDIQYIPWLEIEPFRAAQAEACRTNDVDNIFSIGVNVIVVPEALTVPMTTSAMSYFSSWTMCLSHSDLGVDTTSWHSAVLERRSPNDSCSPPELQSTVFLDS